MIVVLAVVITANTILPLWVAASVSDVFSLVIFYIKSHNMIILKCQTPLRIKNPYTKSWLYVPCRKCDACRINNANTKALQLHEEIKKYPYALMVTLTYENNSLPFMVRGSTCKYRGVFNGSIPEVISNTDIDTRIFEEYLPTGFPHYTGFTGVLHYPDFQNFIKRLRIKYERKTKSKWPWRYHYLCEYGSSSKRPHGHFLFYGSTEFSDSFRGLVVESWKMCNWNRLDLEESFKFASEGIADYLSSYLNCFFNSSRFLSSKGIATRCFRSKDIAYATPVKMEKTFQTLVKLGFRGRLLRANGFPFFFCDKSKLNHFSYSLLSKKYISSVFQKPAGLSKSNFNDFCCIIADSIGSKTTGEVENSDYLTRLSFKKYGKIKNRPPSLSLLLDFIWDNWLISNYYNCLLIRQSMLEYETMSPVEYYQSRYQSDADDPQLREYKLAVRGKRILDGVNDYGNLVELDAYVKSFNSKLLPKHLKDLLWIQFLKNLV